MICYLMYRLIAWMYAVPLGDEVFRWFFGVFTFFEMVAEVFAVVVCAVNAYMEKRR